MTLLNLLIVVILFCWSIWGVFDKKALDRANCLDVLLFQHLIFFAEVPFLYLLLNHFDPGWKLTGPVLFWSFLGSMSASLGTFAYLIAMAKAEASYVLGITAAYPLVMQVIAMFMLGEPIVPMRMCGSMLIGFGVACIGWSADKKLAQAQSLRDKWIVGIACFTAMFCWGIFGLFDKKAISFGAPLLVYTVRCSWEIVILLSIFIGMRLVSHKVEVRNRPAWGYCVLSTLCLSVGSLSTLAAFTISSASYVLVITGCYPLLMYVFALMFLKEKMSKFRLIGVSLIVAGGLAVQFTQGL